MTLPSPALGLSSRGDRRLLARWLAASLFLLFSCFQVTWAGVFTVTPVRIYMTPKDRAVAVTITNEGDSPVVLQADVNSWSQAPDGTEQSVLSEDLILSPPIIKLAPKARQVVRLALLVPADASRQLTYRLVLREIPEANAPKKPSVEVPIALALSMPVFITPPAAKRQINCTATRADAKSLAVSCANSGNAYAQLRELALTRGGKTEVRFEGGVYILPGAKKAITLKGSQPIPRGAVQLVAGFDDGTQQTFEAVLP